MRRLWGMVCAGFLLLVLLSGCMEDVRFAIAEATFIEFQSGRTGDRVTVDDPDLLQAIAEEMMHLELVRTSSQGESSGWSYAVWWYGPSGELLDEVVLLAEDVLDWKGQRYTAVGGAIDLSRLEALLEPEEEAPLYDRIPMVQVDGKLYYDTGKESTITGRCGVMDGEILSSVSASEIPTEDGQSNFGSGYSYQYGAEGTIEILIDGRFIVFEHREGSGRTIQFNGRMIDVGVLSEETVAWLDWYNSLPKEEQLAVSMIPPDLAEAAGYTAGDTVDADRSPDL